MKSQAPVPSSKVPLARTGGSGKILSLSLCITILIGFALMEYHWGQAQIHCAYTPRMIGLLSGAHKDAANAHARGLPA